MVQHKTAKNSKDPKHPIAGKQSSIGFKASTPFNHILSLQNTLGNQAVQRLIKSGVLQPKLKVGKRNDIYEKEADQVAKRLMRMPEHDASMKTEEVVRLQPKEEEEEEEERQRRPMEEEENEKEAVQAKLIFSEDPNSQRLKSSQAGDTLGIKATLQKTMSSSAGSQIDSPLASDLSDSFGTDLSRVQFHTGTAADKACQMASARAMTSGSHVYFRQGEYKPSTQSGREFIGHEVAHVIQQASGGVARMPAGKLNGDGELEKDADRKGVNFAVGRKADGSVIGRDGVETSRELSFSSLGLQGKMDKGPLVDSLQLYPSSAGSWKIKITKPKLPPDVLAPMVTRGYDVDGDLSVATGLASMFYQAGWYLEGIYSSGKTSKKFASVRSVVSEGDHCPGSALRGTNKEGKGYLTFAADVPFHGWIEDYVSFDVYQHGYTKHPSQSVIGPNKKVFLGDVLRSHNLPGRKTSVDVSESFSQGWSASASTGTAYSHATSSTHGFSAKLGGKLPIKAAEVSGEVGYSYSKSDQKTLSSSMNNVMGISSTKSKSATLHLEPGEVGALVPWGSTVAFKIPSIKTHTHGHVIDKTGHLVMVGAKVHGISPVIETFHCGEDLSVVYKRLEKKIKAFDPTKAGLSKSKSSDARDVRHDAVLDMSPETFAKDKKAQEQLFSIAKRFRKIQQGFASALLKDNKIENGKVKSVLKRDDFGAFVRGVVEKCKRNGYHCIGQMEDIVRGRFDLQSEEDVDMIAAAINKQSEYPVKETVPPRRPQPGGGFGYPRWHIIVQDPDTGLSHEWQVGTEAVSKLYETSGIKVPKEMKGDVKKGKIKNDLHDIEYDIFRGIENKHPDVHERHGLPDFHNKVDQVATEAGRKGAKMPDLRKKIRKLHHQAADYLQKLIDEFGIDWIRKFYH